MTDYPRPGDRVKITLEGEVREADRLGRHVTLVGVGGWVPTPRGSVEIRERIYKPGTVAVYDEYPDIPLVRDVDGWRTRDGSLSVSDDRTVATDSHWTVVHEPQAR